MSVQQEKFKAIADKIREKTNTTDLIAPNDFAEKIDEVYDKGLRDGRNEATEVYSTDIIEATSYSEATGRISIQEDMFFPGQHNATAIPGIHMLLEGEQVYYKGILFSGKETALAVEYACYTNSYRGNFDVYLDAVIDDNLIASAKNLDGGEWGWPTVKTHNLPLLKEISEGVHGLYFVGHNLTEVAPYSETAPSWAKTVSGIRAFRFITTEQKTEKYATDEIAAISYNSYSGIGNQQPMFFPGQSNVNLLMGINNLKDGNWARYDDIIFTGNETVFSFDYATITGVYKGNINVYIDEINDDNLIASARNVDGGSYGWYTLKTNRVGLLQEVSEGIHSVIIVGLESSKGEEYTENQELGTSAGISTFRFTEGFFATDDILATEYDAYGAGEGNYWDAWTQGMTTSNGYAVTGIHGLRDGNWLQFNNIIFTGNEGTFSIDYTHNSANTYGNLEVYLVNELNEETLIAKGENLNTNAGWTALRTIEFKLLQAIKSGVYNVKIVGLPLTVHTPNTGWPDANTIVGFYAFKFNNAPEKDEKGRYLFSEYSTGGTPMYDDTVNGTDPNMPSWVGNLGAGSQVKMPLIPFTEEVKYLTLYSRYWGVNVDVYADSVSEENRIATVKNSRPNYIEQQVPFFEAVTVPLEKSMVGFHDLIFVTGGGTDLGAFELLTNEDILDMQNATINASEFTTKWGDGAISGSGVNGLDISSLLAYKAVNFNNVTTIKIGVSGNEGTLDFKVYDNDTNTLKVVARANVSSWAETHTVSVTLNEVLNGVYSLYVIGKNGYGINLESIQFTNDFALMDTALYDSDGNYVSLHDVDFDWKENSEYTLTADVAGITNKTPFMAITIIGDDKYIMDATSKPNIFSVTFATPSNMNYDSSIIITNIFEQGTLSNLVSPMTQYQEITIGCIGDSITEGYPIVSYVPTIKSNIPNVDEVYNFGKTGATVESTIGGQALLYDACAAECSIYTIMLGTNEALKNATWSDDITEKYKTQYRILINKVLEASPNAVIFLATCPKMVTDDPTGARSDQHLNNYIIPAIYDIADEYSLNVIDLNGKMADYISEGNTLTSWGYADFVHFNEAGAEKIGQFFAEEINRYLN